MDVLRFLKDKSPDAGDLKKQLVRIILDRADFFPGGGALPIFPEAWAVMITPGDDSAVLWAEHVHGDATWYRIFHITLRDTDDPMKIEELTPPYLVIPIPDVDVPDASGFPFNPNDPRIN